MAPAAAAAKSILKYLKDKITEVNEGKGNKEERKEGNKTTNLNISVLKCLSQANWTINQNETSFLMVLRIEMSLNDY